MRPSGIKETLGPQGERGIKAECGSKKYISHDSMSLVFNLLAYSPRNILLVSGIPTAPFQERCDFQKHEEQKNKPSVR